MGCCESDEEETRHLVKEHTPTRHHRVHVQETRKSDYTPISGTIPVLPIISPLPAQDRTLNSFLAQSIPGSLQEASFIAPTALEEDLERYELVVNKTMKDFIDLSQLGQESMATFISLSDKMQLYREKTDDGCLRPDAPQPADLIPALLDSKMHVMIGTDNDPALTSETMNFLVPHFFKMDVKHCGSIMGTLSEDEDEM